MLFVNVNYEFLQMCDICPLPAHVLLYGHNAPTITGIMGQPQGAFLMIHRDKPWMLGTECRDAPWPCAQHFGALIMLVILSETSL